MDTTKHYVFYDGDCGFCNHWVQWILKNDKNDQFRYAALQSDFGQNFLKERGLNHQEFNTLYLWKPGGFYLKKSEAITQIAKTLGGKFALLSYINIFPKFIGDFFYDKVAERRLKLANQQCYLPTPEERGKFIN